MVAAGRFSPNRKRMREAYAFGPFVLDPADRRLLRDGQPVEVSARYFDALTLLAAENGRLVTKERFHDEVWRGIPVTDEALTQCIRSLRRALDDDAAAPRYIETVPRHGYRFVAAVNSPASPSCSVSSSPRRWWTQLAWRALAGALGGGAAGIVGALGYVMAGLVAPGIGAASTLLVLISVNLLLGLGAGAFVAGGSAAAMHAFGRAPAWAVAGGAAGGLLVGAVARMIGTDLLSLFFGQAPTTMTGAAEGLALGSFTGLAAWLALRAQPASVIRRIAPAPLLGIVAGLGISLAGGRLMIGSLAALSQGFPASRLRVEDLGSAGLPIATAIECALFAGCVAAALAIAERLSRGR